MKEWDYRKNDIEPENLMVNSNRKVWWKCSTCGFEYEAYVSNRNKGTGCKMCAGQIIIPGKNDLETIHPCIAAEWDYDKNKDIIPSMVFPKSNKSFYWKCKYGHSWNASANSRTNGRGCPYCSGNKVLEGFNDLATTHPEIASQWHPTKNNGLLPSHISKGYTKKVWFLCPKCNGEYDSHIGNKIKGYGKCPYCSKRKTRAKYVYQVETGMFFNTLKEAALAVGGNDIRQIQMCCVGRCKTAYGFHWEYREKQKEP